MVPPLVIALCSPDPAALVQSLHLIHHGVVTTLGQGEAQEAVHLQ